MRRATGVALLGVVLLSTVGVSHCEEGHKRAYSQLVPCITTLTHDGGIRGPAPDNVVIAMREASGPGYELQAVLEVNTCGASLLRVENGQVERFWARLFDSHDAEELHLALAEAGAGDIGAVADCGAVTSRSYQTSITFFEPLPVAGRALSNSFRLGNCPLDERGVAVLRVLSSWVDEHIGLYLFL